MKSPSRKMLHVVAAAIIDAQGEVLITQRPKHLHQGGLWEFPGGKLEADETRWQGLVRELSEELGVIATEGRPLICVTHDYDEFLVKLDVWRVTRFEGEPTAREGQQMAWVSPRLFPGYTFPPADVPVLTALRLPDRYAITDVAVDDTQFFERLRRVLDQGVRLVQFRDHDLSRADYLRRAGRALHLCREHGAALLLNAPLEWLSDCDADGVHLTGWRLREQQTRPLPNSRWVAASCHSADDVLHARRIGVDFIVLSPVQATASHPDIAPLGWQTFAEWTAQAFMPVYALGGVGENELQTAWEHGAQGVAGIRAWWK